MSGNTKREPPISWRPSKAAREKLAFLTVRTGLSRNDLLNRMILDYGVPEVTEPHSARAQFEQRQADQQRQARVVARINPDKILDFQRKVGMDKVKKRG